MSAGLPWPTCSGGPALEDLLVLPEQTPPAKAIKDRCTVRGLKRPAAQPATSNDSTLQPEPQGDQAALRRVRW